MRRDKWRGDGRRAYVTPEGAVWCRRCAAARWGMVALAGSGAQALGLGVIGEGQEGEESCEECGGPCSADLRVPAEVAFRGGSGLVMAGGELWPVAGGRSVVFTPGANGLIRFDRPEAVSSVQRAFLARVLRYRGGDRQYYVVAGPPYAAGSRYVIDTRTGGTLIGAHWEAKRHGDT